MHQDVGIADQIMLFADLLALHLVTFLGLYMSLFLAADACLS